MIKSYRYIFFSLFLFFIFSAGASLSYALSYPIERSHKDGSPEILITKLNINLSEQLLNQPQHFCPVHGVIMKGPFCKLKQSFGNNLKSGSKDKREECFISIDDSAFPLGAVPANFHLEYKFVEPAMSDMALIIPCSIFTCSEFKEYSQGFFNPPDKPPKHLS